MDTMFSTLLQLPLLQGLSHEDLTNILEKVKMAFKKHKSEEVIAGSGLPCDRLIFLLKGKVSSETASTDGTYLFTEQIEAPYVVEPHSLFGMNTVYVSSYIALTEVHVISISKTFVLSELMKYDIFRLNYMNVISNRAQNLYTRLWDKATGNTEEKIIRFILNRSGKPQGEKTLNIRMEDLAEQVDSTRLQVSKALNSLQKENLIVLHRKEIVIPETAALEERSEQM